MLLILTILGGEQLCVGFAQSHLRGDQTQTVLSKNKIGVADRDALSGGVCWLSPAVLNVQSQPSVPFPQYCQ